MKSRDDAAVTSRKRHAGHKSAAAVRGNQNKINAPRLTALESEPKRGLFLDRGVKDEAICRLELLFVVHPTQDRLSKFVFFRECLKKGAYAILFFFKLKFLKRGEMVLRI